MIKKLWVKFDNSDDVECVCDCDRKKCQKEKNPGCSIYIVKFIEVPVEERYNKAIREINKEIDAQTELVLKIKRNRDKLNTQLKNSIRQFKI